MNNDDMKKLIADIKASEPISDLYDKALKIGFAPEWRDPAHRLEDVAACMTAVGISTVSEGEQIIARHAGEVEAFMKDVLGDRPWYRWEVSPGFVMAFALMIDQPEVFTADRLKEMGWDEDPITQVRSALDRRR